MFAAKIGRQVVELTAAQEQKEKDALAKTETISRLEVEISRYARN